MILIFHLPICMHENVRKHWYFFFTPTTELQRLILIPVCEHIRDTVKGEGVSVRTTDRNSVRNLASPSEAQFFAGDLVTVALPPFSRFLSLLVIYSGYTVVLNKSGKGVVTYK